MSYLPRPHTPRSKPPRSKPPRLTDLSPECRSSWPTLGFITLLLLLLNACVPLREPATPSTQRTPSSWPAHQAEMTSIDSWQLKGKLAYRNNADSGSVWFDWTQHGDNFKIFLSGPLGVGTVQISGSPQAVTLSQPGEADINAHSSSSLTQRLFGWQLPVEQIRYWVRGIPASSSNAVIKTFNTEGLLDYLQEDDWQLTVSRYQTGPHGPLPGKIEGHNDELAFTLLLKAWSFPEHNPQHSTANPSDSPPSHSPDK